MTSTGSAWQSVSRDCSKSRDNLKHKQTLKFGSYTPSRFFHRFNLRSTSKAALKASLCHIFKTGQGIHLHQIDIEKWWTWEHFLRILHGLCWVSTGGVAWMWPVQCAWGAWSLSGKLMAVFLIECIMDPTTSEWMYGLNFHLENTEHTVQSHRSRLKLLLLIIGKGQSKTYRIINQR